MNKKIFSLSFSRSQPFSLSLSSSVSFSLVIKSLKAIHLTILWGKVSLRLHHIDKPFFINLELTPLAAHKTHCAYIILYESACNWTNCNLIFALFYHCLFSLYQLQSYFYSPSQFLFLCVALFFTVSFLYINYLALNCYFEENLKNH